MAGLGAGDFDGNDRFLIQERLGAGGYGVVYRAFAQHLGCHQDLRHLAAKALIQFKQEFRALADVSHPNLVDLVVRRVPRPWRSPLRDRRGRVEQRFWRRSGCERGHSHRGSGQFVRLGADFQIFFDEGEGVKTIRLAAGISF